MRHQSVTFSLIHAGKGGSMQCGKTWIFRLHWSCKMVSSNTVLPTGQCCDQEYNMFNTLPTFIVETDPKH